MTKPGMPFKKSVGVRRLGACAFLLTVLLLSAPLTARAGDCVENYGTDGGQETPAGHTSVHNETAATTVQVEIFRGTTSKHSATIVPGETTGFLAKVNNKEGGGTIRTKLRPVGGMVETECAYKLRWDAVKFWWRLLDGADQVCGRTDGIRIACEKTYHKGKMRWNTAFTVTD